MTGVWAKWEGLVIDGGYPLRRFLGRSNHSVVFLTELGGPSPDRAAIKLIPAEPATEEAQLSRWKAVAALSHPGLVRIFASGRCRLGGHPFLFVVMEYAEQTLAQILLHRPLTTDEVREMLLPTLEALAFLHGKKWVQGRLKPPNVLVVGDRLKLASDNLRPAGDSAPDLAKPSPYDSPEAKEGGVSGAGDIWGLGVTIVEALTQSPPTWPDERRETAFFPANVPTAFVDIVRRCLSRNPANRPTIADLEAQIERTSQTPAISASETTEEEVAAASRAVSNNADVSEAAATGAMMSEIAVSEAAVSEATVGETALRDAAMGEIAANEIATNAVAAVKSLDSTVPTRSPPTQQLPFRVIAVGSLVALVVLWAGWRLFHSHPDHLPPTSSDSQTSLQQAASSAGTSQSPAAATAPSPRASASSPTSASASASTAAVHQVIPDVPRHARESIRGRIKVTVRVTVDRSGNVIGERLVSSSSSRYFARLASDAAAKWKFAPADKQGSREWLLRFEFTRGGAIGQVATPPT